MSSLPGVHFRYRPGDVVDGHEVVDIHSERVLVTGKMIHRYRLKSIHLAGNHYGYVDRDEFEKRTTGNE